MKIYDKLKFDKSIILIAYYNSETRNNIYFKEESKMAKINYDAMKEYLDDVAATKEKDYIPSDMKEVVKLGTNVKRYREEEYYGRGKRRWWK